MGPICMTATTEDSIPTTLLMHLSTTAMPEQSLWIMFDRQGILPSGISQNSKLNIPVSWPTYLISSQKEKPTRTVLRWFGIYIGSMGRMYGSVSLGWKQVIENISNRSPRIL